MDLESLHKIIKHPIRRKIMLTLLQKQEVAYIDLMNILEIENTGKFNYHLKILGDLIEKNTDGKYRLTEKGQLASQLLLRFPEKKSERMPLHGGDAILIGFAGFLIALANPGFWFFYLITILGVGILYLGLVYGLMVPGGVMWFLTARRTNSHDPYDLFKPPLASFTLFILLLIFMRFLNISITISVPYQDSSSLAITQPTLSSFLLIAFFPFVGVGIFEIMHRILKKTRI